MLRIDRVKTEMEVLPSGEAGGATAAAPANTAELLADPRARERLKEVVLDVLREHLRALERGGVV
jgi:hypothetical protein